MTAMEKEVWGINKMAHGMKGLAIKPVDLRSRSWAHIIEDERQPFNFF